MNRIVGTAYSNMVSNEHHTERERMERKGKTNRNNNEWSEQTNNPKNTKAK